jgi:hypothetical protein
VFRWSLGLSLAAACLATVSLAISGHRAGMEWGNVGEWVGGVGSFAAAGVALWIGLDGNRRYRRGEAAKTTEARERAARRAKRVHLTAQAQVGGDFFDPRTVVGYTAAVLNSSGRPIYDMTWYPPVVVVPANGPRAQEVYCATDAKLGGTPTLVLKALPRVIEPTHTSRITADLAPVQERNNNRSVRVTVYPVAAFEDDDGNRFGWVLEPVTDPVTQTYSGHWDFVDDNYPYECEGVLRDLFDQVEGWSPLRFFGDMEQSG